MELTVMRNLILRVPAIAVFWTAMAVSLEQSALARMIVDLKIEGAL
jgi:hypothetical protein